MELSGGSSGIVKKQRSTRASTLQIEDLVSYMEKHSRFAAGRFNGNDGKLQLQLQWDELSKRLNSLPGPEKSVKQWQTVWRDLKSISSKKASKIRADRQRTGNFPTKESPLQNIERRVISAIGLDYVEGNTNCPDSCVEEDESIERLEEGDEDPLYQIPQTSTLQDIIFTNEERRDEEISNIIDEDLTLRDVETLIDDNPDAVDSESIRNPQGSRKKQKKGRLSVQKSVCPTTDAA